MENNYPGEMIVSEPTQEQLETPAEPSYDLKTLTDVQDVITTFQATMNQFLKLVRDFKGSKRQLEDVLIALTVHPMVKDEPEFSYPDQKVLFDMGVNVNSSKFFLVLAGMEKEKKIKFIDGSSEQTPDLSIPGEQESVDNSTENV